MPRLHAAASQLPPLLLLLLWSVVLLLLRTPTRRRLGNSCRAPDQLRVWVSNRGAQGQQAKAAHCQGHTKGKVVAQRAEGGQRQVDKVQH